MRIIRNYQEDEGFGGAEVFYVVYGDCRATLKMELEEELRETGRGGLPSLNLWSSEGYIHAQGEKYAGDAEILPDLDDDGNAIVKRFEGYNI